MDSTQTESVSKTTSNLYEVNFATEKGVLTVTVKAYTFEGAIRKAMFILDGNEFISASVLDDSGKKYFIERKHLL